MAPPREIWTDERLDDLVKHIDARFDAQQKHMDARFDAVMLAIQIGFGLCAVILVALIGLIATQL